MSSLTPLFIRRQVGNEVPGAHAISGLSIKVKAVKNILPVHLKSTKPVESILWIDIIEVVSLAFLWSGGDNTGRKDVDGRRQGPEQRAFWIAFAILYFSYMFNAAYKFLLLCMIPMENPNRIQLHNVGGCCSAYHLWSSKCWVKTHQSFASSDAVIEILYFQLPIFYFYGWLKEFQACCLFCFVTKYYTMNFHYLH